MIWFLGILVLVSIAVAIPELFADSGSPKLNVKEMLSNLQSRYALLDSEMGKMRADLNAANKQLVYAREKETEFVAKVFEQRKELDSKAQEFIRLMESNKSLQEKVFQMEKVEEMIRRQSDKISIELKIAKDENELLRHGLEAAQATTGKRKKLAETTAN